MKKTLFIFICLQSILTFGQNNDFKWARHFGGNDDNYGISIALDANGNSYTGGYFMATSDLNPGVAVLNFTSNGSNDAYITKLDHLGNFVWAKRIGGIGDDQILSVTVDNSGNVYATGYFTETVDFNPGAGVFNRTSVGFKDVFVLKLDSNGNFLWVKTFGGTDTIYGDIGNSIALDDLGNVYTTGSFRGVVDFDPGIGVVNMNAGSVTMRSGFILKLDADGNFIWVKGFISSESSLLPNSIAIDPLGNIYTGGRLVGTADFDPGSGVYNLITQGASDAFVSKLDASGNFLWAKSWGSASNDGVHSLAIDEFQNVYTTGYFSETVDFDPSAMGISDKSATGLTDIFVSKLNTLGNFEWANTFGGTVSDEGNSITAKNGNIYTTGYFRNLADFDPDPINTYNLDATGLNQEIYILKMNYSGHLVWVKEIGSTSIDIGNCIMVDNADNIYTTGRFNFTVDFDPDPIDVFTIYNNQPAAFVLKLGTACSPATHSISETACGSFTWTAGNGQIYNTSTTATHTLSGGAANGCDSIITLNLTVNQPTSSTLNITNCGAYTLNGQSYASSGIYTQVVQNTNNCDSTITLNLTVNQPTSSTLNVTNCGPYTLNGQSYASSGTYTQVVQNVNNCDSTITLNLTVNQPTSSSLNITNCGTYTLNGQSYASSGTYTQIIPNANNCDSTITLNLTVNNVDNTVTISGITLTANQAGGTYQWMDCDNGNTPISGEVSQSFTPSINGNYALEVTANGCTETSNCTLVNTVGIEELPENDWRVYPNPSNGVFTITSQQAWNHANIEVYSALGQLIYSSMHAGEKIIIDLKDQPTGVYVLKVNKQQNFRVVKL